MPTGAKAAGRQGGEAGCPPGPPTSRPAHAGHWMLVVGLVVVLGLAGYQLVRKDAPKTLPPAIDTARGAASGFNVALITLDTLRADHLGCYGYRRIETPAIDALASAGVRFASAATPVPITLPAHASILTGQYPPVHGVRDNGTYRLVAERETLAERLKSAGYATAAFIAAFVLDHRYGLDQGFDVYDDEISLEHRRPGVRHEINPQRPGNIVTDAAIKWLEEHCSVHAGTPFFVWLHLFDPHTPYDPPEPFRTRYATSHYDGEIAFADQQVGRFVDKLGQLNLWENTVVVVVGDHGEGLGDHGESNHSLLIYGSTMMVPLIFWSPSVVAGGEVVNDRIVSTVDVTPTILDLLGLPLVEGEGVSLLRSDVDAERAVYLETLSSQLTHGWSPLFGLQRHYDKYIEAPTPEYYDLSNDPRELRNLIGDGHAEAGALRKRLASLTESLRSKGGADASVNPDTEAMAKLAALGYAGQTDIVEDAPLPDPKEMIVGWEQTIAARVFVEQGQHEKALPLLDGLIAKSPKDAKLWSLLSYAQAQARLFDEAITSRKRAITLQPGYANYWLHLAELQYRKGEVEASNVSLTQAERLEPDHGGIPLSRAQQALDLGNYAEALTFCEQARDRDPTRQTAPSWVMQGRVHSAQGDSAAARAAYEQALVADPHDPEALWSLATMAERSGEYEGVIQFCRNIARGSAQWPRAQAALARAYLKLGRENQAVELMREVTRVFPASPGAHNDLGNVLYQLGRLSEASPCYKTALQLDPRYVTARYNLAMVLKEQGQASEAIDQLRRVLELDTDSTDALFELATLLEATGQIADAERSCSRLLKIAPRDARGYSLGANLYDRLDAPRAAIELLRRGHEQIPEDVEIMRSLAWRLATASSPDIDDGEQALPLAEELVDAAGPDQPQALDVLAAAYARVGRFEDAANTAKRALKLANELGLAGLAEEIGMRLDLYENGKPYFRP